jgi:regulatory protein
VDDLVARGHVDDRAFALAWVDARSARGIGVARLRAELRARGVARQLIESALAGADPDHQLQAARAVARRRLPTLRRGRPDRIGARLHDHLLRRGYPAAIVARVVRESLGLATDEATS